MGNIEMSTIDDSSERYISLTEVVKKLGCSENKVIEWGGRGLLYLWCFKPILPGMEKKWCIVGDALDFIRDKTLKESFSNYWLDINVICSTLYVSPNDRVPSDLNKTGSWKKVEMDVARSDLYLDRDDIAMMKRDHPGLVGEEVKIDTDSKTGEPNSAIKSNEKCEGKGRSTRIIRMPIHGAVSPPLSQDTSGSSAPSSPNLEAVTTVDNQLSLSVEVDQESKLINQAEKTKTAKQPKKKNGNADTPIIGGLVEPIPQVEDNKGLPPSQRLDVLRGSYLRLKDIVGSKKEGVPAIIPVSKTTWWEGVKSGRYPQSVKLSERCTAWKASDIMELLKVMEKGAE